MDKVKNTLAAVFKIRAGEGRPTFLLLLHSFFTGISMVYLETASYALFLKNFDSKALPFVYIVSALVTTFFGLIYSRLEETLSFSKLLILTLGAILFSTAAFYAGMRLAPSPGVIMAMIIWYNVAFVLTGLEFWSLASRLLDVRQGKRLFGLIGVGDIIATILGGVSVSVMVKQIGTVNLLLLSAAGMACCIAVLIHITRQMAGRLLMSEEEESGEATEIGAGGLLREKYFFLILCVSALSVFGYYLLDYIFYNQVELHYPGEDQVASFLGGFIAFIGIINLISNAFLHSRLIERYGLSLGLLAVPVAVSLGSASSVVITLAGIAGIFFWLMVVTKAFDEICRTSIEEPSIRILYQPFSPAQRLRSQTVMETIVEPVASALVGGLLLLLTSVLGFEANHLIYVIILVLALWIFAAILLKREYTNALTRALTKRKLGGGVLALRDGASIEVLRKGLNSSIPGEVINCLNLLEEIEHETLERALIDLISHPDPRVREHALKKIGDLGISSANEPIRNRLESEENPKVLGTALRTLCAVSEAEAFEFVFTYLEDPDVNLEVRRGAMAGLLRNGGIDGVLSAGAKLNDLRDSKIADERKLAAEVLGEVGISSFYRPLLKLLEDSDAGVRRAAISASGKLRNPRLLPALLENFAIPDFSTAAVSAVTAFGPDILPDVEAAFDREDQTRQVRIKIIRVISRVGGNRATEILKKKIDFSEEDIRSHVLSALVSCRYQADYDEFDTIQKRIRDEVADATWSLSVLVDIGDHEDVSLLTKALKSEVDKNRKRIFSLLALIYPPKSIMQAQFNLSSKKKDMRAKALEVLDSLLSQEQKALVFPLVDDIPSAQRHSRLVAHFPQNRMSRHERLKEILVRSQQWTSSWTKICALFVVGKIATREFYDTVIACLSDPDAVVRETAVWALGRLNPDDLVQRLQGLKADKSPRVAEFSRFVINSVGFARIPVGKGGYLTRSGRYTADLFVSILQDDGERTLRRCSAANILSRFRIPAARTALVRSLGIPDKTVRTAVLDALIKGEFVIEPKERGELAGLLAVEVRDTERILESILTISSEKQAKRLISALGQEMLHNRQRILSLMVLLCEDRDFISDSMKILFYWYIRQENRPVPDTVKECFGHLVTLVRGDGETKSLSRSMEKVVILFRFRNPARLKALWDKAVPGTSADVERHLRQIAFGSSVFTLSWSRICAMDLIVRLRLSGCVPQIIGRLRDKDDMVRATSAWALFQLAPREYRKYAGELRNDVSYLVSRTAKQLSGEEV
ncbi:hypothetical protein DENIS_3387 [Desulfonema ishimotonii]|uniref:ADP,ATP carrier protein n=1 Tax=Desulfonema ishimotonii TaxID=45657 RepID=A0A401FZM0_9BACT|nr:Npt1/Npt2 family nucleotide transporter [Desulfonema ishimotonii]GBC62415.1 hypothetical protein DENIS_3387 [Desulfonema ishimotonii]